ncbi:MAG TPA: methylmalonyl-CoA mutase family protein [Rectinemataceae bacterium]|nr:methylmalonyl-CoA mutase family protein [Rectinemataceae bacterium]
MNDTEGLNKARLEEARLAEAQGLWEAGVEKTLAKHPERSTAFVTGSKMPVKRLYTPLDGSGSYGDRLGFPGEYPYTRGVQSTMYRGRFWTMRQYAGFGNAEESNRRYKYLLEQGQTGLSIAFDLPTQIGYDSDHPLAAGEVGKVGVAVDSLEDMETLFAGIPLDKVSTSMTINAPAAVLLAMYVAVAEKQGVPASALDGTIQNDILKEYVARGTYIFPPAPSMRLITDIFAWCAKEVPNWNTISISGYHIREAGSTAVQEVAFTLADGIAYVDAAKRVGLDVDDFAPRLSFFFNAHNDLFEEVAKYRAARRVWAKIMKDRFGAKNPKSLMLRFHTQTGGSTLTAQQPENNVIRVTIQALAAVLGGTQSLHTNSRDEALALPTEESVRIALRTQQIVAYESGVAETIDPLAGSYYVESLTDAIEKEVLAYIERIDKLGGSVKAIEQGFIQQEVQDAAYAHQLDVEKGERVIVGLNKFTVKEGPPKGLLRVDPEVGRSQVEKLAALRARRDGERVRKALASLEAAARDDSSGGDNNLMPPILEAVRSYASLGEICDVLRSVFGEYRPSSMF